MSTRHVIRAREAGEKKGVFRTEGTEGDVESGLLGASEEERKKPDRSFQLDKCVCVLTQRNYVNSDKVINLAATRWSGLGTELVPGELMLMLC